MDVDLAIRLALLLAGVTALRLAVVWRARSRTRRLQELTQLLGAPEPEARVTAAEELVHLGLDRVAQPLLAHVLGESDPAVRASIALAVARRQWEPAAVSGVAELREWASSTLAGHGVPVQGFGPALTRLADMGGPRRPDDGPRAQIQPDEADGTDDARAMILVTGAGGAAGVAVIRELRARGELVVAVDADPLAAGLALADEHAVVALASDESFVPDLCEAAKRFGADVVICTVSEEMLAIAGREDELAEVGAAVWLSPRTSIETCVDKWAFARAMRKAGVPTPRTSLPDDALSVPGPWIVKPRFGRGSRDVHAVRCRRDLRSALARVAEPIVQTCLSGREFTVDLIIDRNGIVAGAVPRWRLETKAGISTKGCTFKNATVTELASTTATALGLRGAVNVQGFVDDDGQVSIIEVNPRVSGGISLTQAAGCDIVGELVRGTRRQRVRKTRLRFKSGVTMRRYFEEVFS